MKLGFFDDFKLGVVAGDGVVDVTEVVRDILRLGPQDVMRGVIERFDTLKGKLADAAAKGQGNGWLNTKMFDETDAVKSQGWTALILDTNGNGKRELEGKLADAAAKGRASRSHR